MKDPLSENKRQLRAMVDAIRALLGKSPLYFHDGELLVAERFHLETMELPAIVREEERWIPGSVGLASTRDSFRDMSVEMAMRRRALRFEERKKDGAR